MGTIRVRKADGTSQVVTKIPQPMRSKINLALDVYEVEKLIQNGKIGEAARSAAQLLEKNPEDSRLLYVAGLVTAFSGDPEGALDFYERAIKDHLARVKELTAAEIMASKAQALFELGRQDAAIAELRRAIETVTPGIEGCYGPQHREYRERLELAIDKVARGVNPDLDARWRKPHRSLKEWKRRHCLAFAKLAAGEWRGVKGLFNPKLPSLDFFYAIMAINRGDREGAARLLGHHIERELRCHRKDTDLRRNAMYFFSLGRARILLASLLRGVDDDAMYEHLVKAQVELSKAKRHPSSSVVERVARVAPLIDKVRAGPLTREDMRVLIGNPKACAK